MLTLTDDMRIGHPQIDADHQRLIDIINEFNQHSKSLKNELLMHETLKALLVYGRGHFEREERIQRECMYPRQEQHRAEHKALLEQVQDTARMYFVKKTRPLDEEAIKDLNAFLKKWLCDHVSKFDVAMRAWVGQDEADSDPCKFSSLDMSILIVGADAAARASLSKLLTGMGAARILEAADCLEGLRQAFGDPVPDMVFCELESEPVDGLALAGAIRSSGKDYIARIPVIILSSSPDGDGVKKALAAGAAGLFPKAFNPKDLSRFLCRVMSNSGIS